VYENESIKNLIRYTRHKIHKNAASKLESDDISMPTIADINPKEGMDFNKVKSVIKLKHQNISKTVVKITAFLEPSDIDFNEILGKLPPINYTAIQEVELEEEEPEEDKQLYEKLKQIPDGLTLADILADMHDDMLELEE
jgi:hypothetical protein